MKIFNQSENILLTPSPRIFKSHSLIIACLQYKTLRSCPDTIKIRILYTTIWSMIMLVSSRDGPAIGDQTRTCILFTVFRCYIAFNTNRYELRPKNYANVNTYFVQTMMYKQRDIWQNTVSVVVYFQNF